MSNSVKYTSNSIKNVTNLTNNFWSALNNYDSSKDLGSNTESIRSLFLCIADILGSVSSGFQKSKIGKEAELLSNLIEIPLVADRLRINIYKYTVYIGENKDDTNKIEYNNGLIPITNILEGLRKQNHSI